MSEHTKIHTCSTFTLAFVISMLVCVCNYHVCTAFRLLTRSHLYVRRDKYELLDCFLLHKTKGLRWPWC